MKSPQMALCIGLPYPRVEVLESWGWKQREARARSDSREYKLMQRPIDCTAARTWSVRAPPRRAQINVARRTRRVDERDASIGRTNHFEFMGQTVYRVAFEVTKVDPAVIDRATVSQHRKIEEILSDVDSDE